jgi:hypothetical protein
MTTVSRITRQSKKRKLGYIESGPSLRVSERFRGAGTGGDESEQRLAGVARPTGLGQR